MLGAHLLSRRQLRAELFESRQLFSLGLPRGFDLSLHPRFGRGVLLRPGPNLFANLTQFRKSLLVSSEKLLRFSFGAQMGFFMRLEFCVRLFDLFPSLLFGSVKLFDFGVERGPVLARDRSES